MSEAVRHELNTLLVDQVNSFAAVLEQRNLARDAAITLEQELAAAEADALEAQTRIARVLDLLDAVLTLQPADPDTGDRNVSLFALMEAMDGEEA